MYKTHSYFVAYSYNDNEQSQDYLNHSQSLNIQTYDFVKFRDWRIWKAIYNSRNNNPIIGFCKLWRLIRRNEKFPFLFLNKARRTMVIL